jgi:hypothetical protein
VNWRKLGRITAPGDRVCGSGSYGTLPTPLVDAKRGTIRLFLGVMRDGRGRIGYLDVAAEDPLRVLEVAEEPALDLGEPGMFDDNGVAPACAVVRGSEIWLYYIGYQLHRRVRFTIFAGLAIADEAGTLRRASRVPLLDRTDEEMFFRSTPFVMGEGSAWRMWYSGGGKWNTVKGKDVPYSEIREATSGDGVSWTPLFTPCVPLPVGGETEALVRPWIIRDDRTWTMYYSERSHDGYRLRCMQSTDGGGWHGAEVPGGLERGEAGWDSQSISYASIAKAGDATYLFYSGNAFGAAGFGVAVLDADG